MEQAEIGFTTMLGSAQRARSFLDELQDFAARTPFEFPDLVTASQRLLALGFEARDVVPVMTSIGDAVAAIGGGAEHIDRAVTAIGQIQAKGRLMAEEMMQLNELGIFSWQMLADAIGTSVPKAMEEVSRGQVSAAEFMQAFQQQTGEAFGGMMEKQSQSLLGLLSTFKDEVMMRLGDVAGPLMDALKGALPKVQEMVVGLIDRVGPPFARLVGMLARTLAGLLPVLQPVLQALAGAVQQVLKALGPALTELVRALAPVVVELARSFADLITVLAPLLRPLAAVVKLVAPLLSTLTRLLMSAITPLVPAVGRVASALMPLVRAVVQLLRVGLEPLIPAVGDLVRAVSPVVVVFAQLLTDVLRPILPLLTKLIRLVLGVVKAYYQWLARSKVLEGIADIVAGVVRAVIGWVRDLLGAVSGVWGRIVDVARGAWDRIRGVWSGVRGWFAGLFDGIKRLASDAWYGIVDTVKRIWNGLAGLWNRGPGSWRIGFPTWFPGPLKGKGWDVPDLPYLAHGGIVTRPTVAVLGEAGPEAVVPLSQATDARELGRAIASELARRLPRRPVTVSIDRRVLQRRLDAAYLLDGVW